MLIRDTPFYHFHPLNDYMGYFRPNSRLALGKKRWTTREIYEEVKKVIDCLEEKSE